MIGGTAENKTVADQHTFTKNYAIYLSRTPFDSVTYKYMKKDYVER